MYADAEQRMLAHIAKQLAKGVDSPAWAEQKLAQMNTYMDQMRRLALDMGRQAENFATDGMAMAFEQGGLQAVQDIFTKLYQPAGIPARLGQLPALGLMTNQLTGQLNAMRQQILRVANDEYRKAITAGLEQKMLGTMTQRQAVQQALDKFAAKGITGFIDKAGRKWTMEAYADMATRTGTMHAAVQGHLETLKQNGFDLVIVDEDGEPCPDCVDWEGMILALTPNDVYPTVEDAMSGGLFHPGCKHNVSLYQEGVTAPYTPKTDAEREVAAQRYADTQHLRYLEREVRASKRTEAVAMDPAAKAKARSRVRTYQGKIRRFVDERPGTLYRQPFREQMGVSKQALAKEVATLERKAKADLLRVLKQQQAALKQAELAKAKLAKVEEKIPEGKVFPHEDGTWHVGQHPEITIERKIESNHAYYRVRTERPGYDPAMSDWYATMKEAKAAVQHSIGHGKVIEATAKGDVVKLEQIDQHIAGVQRWKVVGNEDYYITTDSHGLFIVRHNPVKPGQGLKFFADEGSAGTLEEARIMIERKLYPGKYAAADKAKVDVALAKEKATGKLVIEKRSAEEWTLPGHPEYHIKKNGSVYTVEKLDSAGHWQLVRNSQANGYTHGYLDGAKQTLRDEILGKQALVQEQLPHWFHPSDIKKAEARIKELTGGSSVVGFKPAGASRFRGSADSVDFQLMHIDQLGKELTRLFNEFPGLKRNAVKDWLNIRTPRAQSSMGGGFTTWSHSPWSGTSTMSAEAKLAEYLHGRYGGYAMKAYFPGLEVEGCIRHEYCHALQTWAVMRKWEEVANAMGKIKFRKWYRANVSDYLGDKPSTGWACESMAECFTRYTEPANQFGFNGYQRGTFPKEIEDFFDRLVEGRL